MSGRIEVCSFQRTEASDFEWGWRINEEQIYDAVTRPVDEVHIVVGHPELGALCIAEEGCSWGTTMMCKIKREEGNEWETAFLLNSSLIVDATGKPVIGTLFDFKHFSSGGSFLLPPR